MTALLRENPRLSFQVVRAKESPLAPSDLGCLISGYRLIQRRDSHYYSCTIGIVSKSISTLSHYSYVAYYLIVRIYIADPKLMVSCIVCANHSLEYVPASLFFPDSRVNTGVV